jgi:capsular exopolysaccharide synthesis family protein
MDNQFSFDEQVGFDFKVFLLKILSHWKWFLASLIIAFFVAHYLNVRQKNIYELDSYVTIKEENNPFFTSNMSLVFNWGGVSDKVNLVVTTFKSRTHNEKVVDQLKSYIVYQKQYKYYVKDIYKKSPFVFEMDKNKPQLINQPIEIKIIDNEQFVLKLDIKDKKATLYDYIKKKPQTFNIKSFSQSFRFGEDISLPFLSGKFILKQPYQPDSNYYLLLKDYNKAVTHYKENLSVKTKDKNSSILVLKLQGNNKQKLADYLNTTTSLLQAQILNDKNKFAINTIAFIDSTLQFIQKDLNIATKELKKFISNKTVLNLDDPTSKLYEKISGFDVKKNTIVQKKLYYEQLLNYLKNKKNYEDLPAPTVVGIEDPTIVPKVVKITQLAITRKQELTNFKEDATPIKRIDLEIEALRKSLLETVELALLNLNQELNLVNKNIKILETQINKLPEEKQVLLSLRRKYELKQEIYNTLLQKRNEASIVKASNVSDLKIIDNARDVGQSPVAPNRKMNYLIALLAGLLLPALVIFILYLLDNKIHDISDVEELTDVPLLGQVFHHDKKGNLPVKDYPQGIVTESFRSLRSALRFMLPREKKSHTILITSSVSGEGKTFVSTNLSLIQASGNKKTVILEFDLRKPKFKTYFNEASHNHSGLSHYLSGNANINDIIVHTDIPNLDLILSGSIPPNPSELILTEYTNKLFNELSERYEQVIIDSPPLGLVSDALELQKFADVTIFIVRENYSLKSFVKDIDERYKKSEQKSIAIIYNDFKVNLLKKYGYSKNYGYKYGYGYGGYFENKDSFIKKWFKSFKK